MNRRLIQKICLLCAQKIPQFCISTMINSLYILWLKQQTSHHNILVISLVEHLGDIVACEPVIRAASEKHDLIYWVCAKNYASIFKAHPILTNTLSVTCLTEWILLKKLLPSQHVLDLNLDQKRCTWFGFKIHKKYAHVNIHNYYDCQRSLLEALTIDSAYSSIDVSPNLMTKHASPAQPHIAIHALSNESERNWSQEKFNALSNWILDHTPYPIYEYGRQKLLTSHPRVIGIDSALPLNIQISYLQNAVLFIGVDSSFSHIAHALDRLGVVLLGQYRNFEDYLPYSGKWRHSNCCKIVRHAGPLHQLPLEPVIAAIQEKLEHLCQE